MKTYNVSTNADLIKSLSTTTGGAKVFLLDGEDGDLKQIKGCDVVDEDVYRHKDNYEDVGTLSELDEAHGDDFDESDYIISIPKGTVILNID